eukprot:gnl/MRDRNA2_/MRDRNA2_186246_c0_seq1.p1 gnl/MRDRNA2_/MRDRNA2_186246_c0~~gnl/MRDRNA2_/MRDRNA2_186246_c0_seq1.p1  ORF type:complete len:397 (+),score=68.08 gnl/MRDRNA2_/MRDRNA2_186246_c0_seq1:94-1284(+)
MAIPKYFWKRKQKKLLRKKQIRAGVRAVNIAPPPTKKWVDDKPKQKKKKSKKLISTTTLPPEVEPGAILVRNIPEEATEQDLKIVLENIGEVKECFFFTKIGCRDVAIAKYQKPNDAIHCVRRLNEYIWRGAPLKIEHARWPKTTTTTTTEAVSVSESEPEPVLVRNLPEDAETIKLKELMKGATQTAKAGRLIIRNLEYSAGDKHVREIFKPFGEIQEIHIPQKTDGSKGNRGFAFVQYAHVEDALKAVSNVTGTKIGRREIAVDWAVNKKLYSTLQKTEEKHGELDFAADIESQIGVDKASRQMLQVESRHASKSPTVPPTCSVSSIDCASADSTDDQASSSEVSVVELRSNKTESFLPGMVAVVYVMLVLATLKKFFSFQKPLQESLQPLLRT